MMRFINRLEEVLIAALLAGMTLLTFTQVVLRYVFNSGLLWALEATIYMFGWMVLLGISYGIRTRAHIGVDAAVNLLPVRWQRAMGLLAVAICLVYVGLLFYGSWIYIAKLYQIGITAEDIPLPRWLLSSAVPVGMALFGLRLLEVGYDILRGRGAPLLVGNEAKELVEEFEGDPRFRDGEGRP
jgi:C4-dicarboxylate transporter DctQ subunit